MFRLSRVFCHGSNLNNCKTFLIRSDITSFNAKFSPDIKNSGRTLYSLSALGVDGYNDKREKVKQYLVNDAEKFREKMVDFVENDENSMIFTEDLKNMIHLADSTDSDLDLVDRMLRK